MKMKPEHYAILKQAVLEHIPPAPNRRQLWDAVWSAGLEAWICDTLYPYLNDDHIDTALRNIAREGWQP